MDNGKSSEFRTVRGYQELDRRSGKLTPALEDYLEMVYRICCRTGYTRVGKISELLHVKPSSASKMISKLAGLGYLRYERYEMIQLTERGRERGAFLLNRHNTVERFLTLIGVTDNLEGTELIEHSLDPEMVEHLDRLLRFFAENEETQRRFAAFPPAPEP